MTSCSKDIGPVRLVPIALVLAATILVLKSVFVRPAPIMEISHQFVGRMKYSPVIPLFNTVLVVTLVVRTGKVENGGDWRLTRVFCTVTKVRFVNWEIVGAGTATKP